MTIFGINLGGKEGRSAKGQFWYRDAEGYEGKAKWFSVAAQGACLCSSQYLPPGRELTIVGDGMEIDGRIVWCRPMADKENFVAGVRILNQTSNAAPGKVPANAALIEA